MKNNKFFLILFLIIIFSIGIIILIGSKASNKITKYVRVNLEKEIYDYVFNTFSRKIMKNEDLKNTLEINYNREGEIISIDYDFAKCYNLLGKSIKILHDNANRINIKKDNYDQDKNVLFVYLGNLSDNYYLQQLGPRIPIKVNILNNIKMSFSTKVSAYGINTILLELYLNVITETSFIGPIKMEQFNNKYKLIVASTVLNGKIPQYYGGTIEKSSAIISS